jgi:glycosyltransferase involved in cell wall biosynthesis
LNFADGREIVLRDTAAELAQAVTRLLADPGAALRLGQAALQLARRTYERSAVVAQLAAIFRAGCTDGVGRERGIA